LFVLDQFEQWLHARRQDEGTDLIQALRQCDGGRVQCIVMVRDDLWLVVSRFMAALEIELVQGRNMALVDLFDPRHARRVLASFGRAFSALPEGGQPRSAEQDAFLDQAVAGLAQHGKIISVRLALFAEMVKGKPWTPAGGDRQSSAPSASARSPRLAQGIAARERHRHQGPHAQPRRASGGIGLYWSAEGVR
jgi:hypothetical protein